MLASTSLVTQQAHDLMGLTPDQAALLPLGGGATRIFAPDGRSIGSPLPPDEEGLVYATLDLGLISLAKAAADPAGHYARPDVTQLLLNTAPSQPVVHAVSETAAPAVPKTAPTAPTTPTGAGTPIPEKEEPLAVGTK